MDGDESLLAFYYDIVGLYRPSVSLVADQFLLVFCCNTVDLYNQLDGDESLLAFYYDIVGLYRPSISLAADRFLLVFCCNTVDLYSSIN